MKLVLGSKHKDSAGTAIRTNRMHVLTFHDGALRPVCTPSGWWGCLRADATVKSIRCKKCKAYSVKEV